MVGPLNNDAAPARSGAATRPLKERQREERAALVLNAAQMIFAEKGYHAASIDEIAARVGISKGAVYLHFASKEALLEALIAGHITWFIGMVDAVVAEAETVRARLERILTWVYDRMSGESSPLVLELSAIGLADSVLDKRPTLRAQVARATERIGALLDEGKDTGELDTAIPTPVLVSLFVGLLSPPGFDQLLASGQYPSADLVAHVSHIFFAGLTAPSPQEA